MSKDSKNENIVKRSFLYIILVVNSFIWDEKFIFLENGGLVKVSYSLQILFLYMSNLAAHWSRITFFFENLTKKRDRGFLRVAFISRIFWCSADLKKLILNQCLQTSKFEFRHLFLAQVHIFSELFRFVYFMTNWEA